MLVIKNGKILVNNELAQKDILIDNGKITKIEQNLSAAGQTIDASNLIILPGCIDCHVHFRDFTQTHKEDFFTGSKAAAKGGVTTVLVMPNTRPPVLDLETLEKERQLAEKSIVNYGLYMAGADNLLEIKKAKNIAGVKIFMDVTTGNLKVSGDILEELFKSHQRIAVHAEENNVGKAISLISDDSILYLCHISLKEEINTIKKFSKTNVFTEVTPHHLFLSQEDIPRLNSLSLMKPNLRSKEDQQALWQAINDGTISTVGTDHAPHTLEEKQSQNPSFGVPGLETMLPIMLDAVNKGRLTLQRLVELTSKRPAEIFGIKDKGKIAIGYDADLTLVDLGLVKEVKNSDIVSKCGWTPFDGIKLKGWPIKTIVNGNMVYDNGKFNDVKGKDVFFT